MTYKTSDAQQEPTAWYPNPYKGGTWRFADTVAYMNTGSMGLLNWAAANAESIQLDRWRMARTAITKGQDRSALRLYHPARCRASARPEYRRAVFLERMRLSGLEVRLADKPFTEGATAYPAGTAVILAAQANRPQLMDMTLPQNHPMRRQGPDGPPIPPYDIAGWTLTLQMGVDRGSDDRQARAGPARRFGQNRLPRNPAFAPSAPAAAPAGGFFLLPTERNTSFEAANRLLAAGIPVNRWTAAQTINGTAGRQALSRSRRPRRPRKALASIAADLRLPVVAVPNSAVAASVSLRAPRVGTYDPYGGNIAQGWTQYVLEIFDFPQVKSQTRTCGQGTSTNRSIPRASVFPNIRTRAAGSRPAAARTPTAYSDGGMGPGFLGDPRQKHSPPEVATRLEGIGEVGQANLRKFVEDGGDAGRPRRSRRFCGRVVPSAGA